MKKLHMLAIAAMMVLSLFFAAWFYRVFVIEDACYDGGGYIEDGQCITAESCRAAGGSTESGKCVVPSPAK